MGDAQSMDVDLQPYDPQLTASSSLAPTSNAPASDVPTPTDRHAHHVAGPTESAPTDDPDAAALQLMGRVSAHLQHLQQTLQQLRHQQDAQSSRLKQQLAHLAAPRVRHTATQILLHAAGLQTFSSSSPDHFDQPGSSHAVVAEVSALIGVQPGQLASHADTLISRQRSDAQPGSLAALDLEVGEVQGLISAELEAISQWECKVVAAYVHIKAAFPDKFVQLGAQGAAQQHGQQD